MAILILPHQLRTLPRGCQGEIYLSSIRFTHSTKSASKESVPLLCSGQFRRPQLHPRPVDSDRGAPLHSQFESSEGRLSSGVSVSCVNRAYRAFGNLFFYCNHSQDISSARKICDLFRYGESAKSTSFRSQFEPEEARFHRIVQVLSSFSAPPEEA